MMYYIQTRKKLKQINENDQCRSNQALKASYPKKFDYSVSDLRYIEHFSSKYMEYLVGKWMKVMI